MGIYVKIDDWDPNSKKIDEIRPNSTQVLRKVYTRSTQGLHKVYARSTQGLHKVYTRLTQRNTTVVYIRSTQGLHKVYTRSTRSLRGVSKRIDCNGNGGSRTDTPNADLNRDLRIRRPTPYPLGHTTDGYV